VLRVLEGGACTEDNEITQKRVGTGELWLGLEKKSRRALRRGSVESGLKLLRESVETLGLRMCDLQDKMSFWWS